MKITQQPIRPGLIRSLLIASCFLVGTVFTRLHAQEVYAPGGKAINGYDPVAFFTQGKAVKGSDSSTYQWNSATWYFVSKQHLDSFKATPERYAPQYGGYCAYGTAEGHKAPTKPETWTIENGRLYFNYNLNVRKEWDKNRAALIQKADANWPAVKQQQ